MAMKLYLSGHGMTRWISREAPQAPGRVHAVCAMCSIMYNIYDGLRPMDLPLDSQCVR